MEACEVNTMDDADARELINKYGGRHFNPDVCRLINNAYKRRPGTSTRFHFTDISAITFNEQYFDEKMHPYIMSGLTMSPDALASSSLSRLTPLCHHTWSSKSLR
mgnify:CR=1 FL=1